MMKNLTWMCLKKAMLVLVILFTTVALWSGGKQSNISPTTSSSGEGRLSPVPRSLTVYWPAHPSIRTRNDQLSLQLILERTNIWVQYEIDSSGTSERRNLMIATNQLPEMARLDPSEITNHYRSDIFLPLGKYIDQMPNFKRLWDTIPTLKTTMNEGELYGFRNLFAPQVPDGFGPVLRTDLLQKHNLPIPTTFTELLDVLEALKRIYPDSKPWTNRFGTNNIFAAWFAFAVGSGWGIYWDHDVDGGKWLYGQANPSFKEALQIIADAFRRGVLDPDFATNSTDQWRNNIISGRSFFWYDNPQWGQTFNIMIKESDPTAVIELIPFLKNSLGVKRTRPYQDPNVYCLDIGAPWMIALRSDIKDPDTVIKFMDWMYSDEARVMTNWGKEGLSFRYAENGEREYLSEWIRPSLRTADPLNDIISRGGFLNQQWNFVSDYNPTTIAIQKAMGVWDDSFDRYWAINTEAAQEGVFKPNHPAPPLNPQELERLRDLSTIVATFLNQQYNRFITGQEPVANWDNVIREARALGAQEIEDIYNKAEARGW